MRNFISELNQRINISRSASQYDQANTLEHVRDQLTSGEYSVYQVIRTDDDKDRDVLATSLDLSHVLRRFNEEIAHFKAMAADKRGLYYFYQDNEYYAELRRDRNDSLRHKLEIMKWPLA